LEHVLPIQTWDFLNGLKVVIVSFSVFENGRKMKIYEQKGLQAWSTVHMDLDKACKLVQCLNHVKLDFRVELWDM